jgi:hypothetical protein
MNKSRKPLDVRARKKIAKNIYSAQRDFLIKPEKPIAIDSALLETEQRRIKLKKKLVSAHKSKRTTPGATQGRDGAPAHSHKESARWDKAIKLQSVISNKSLTKKLSKKK